MAEISVLDELIVPITIDYLEDDAVYKISCPLLQGCHAWGETLEEAIQSIPGNIRAMIEARRAKNLPIPPLFEHANIQTPFVLRMVPA
jgi:predicted RNase H-like HicB family nuclease